MPCEQAVCMLTVGVGVGQGLGEIKRIRHALHLSRETRYSWCFKEKITKNLIAQRKIVYGSGSVPISRCTFNYGVNRGKPFHSGAHCFTRTRLKAIFTETPVSTENLSYWTGPAFGLAGSSKALRGISPAESCRTQKHQKKT